MNQSYGGLLAFMIMKIILMQSSFISRLVSNLTGNTTAKGNTSWNMHFVKQVNAANQIESFHLPGALTYEVTLPGRFRGFCGGQRPCASIPAAL